MADKRIFDLTTIKTVEDIDENTWVWMDKQAPEGEPALPSWKVRGDLFLKVLNNFAAHFVPNVLTVVGKCYWHGGELFMCNVAYTGDWVPGNFTLTSVDKLFARKDVLTALQTEVSNLTTYAQNVAHSIAPEFDPTRNYVVDESCTFEGMAYIFTSNHPAGAWNPAHATISGQNALLRFTSQNAKDRFGLLPVAKRQIFGSSIPQGITSLNDFNDNFVVEINKTSLTPVTEFPSDYDGVGVLICTKTNYSSSNYRVYQKLIHYASRTMYSRYFDSSNSAWTAWTRNAIEGKFLKTVEKALWASYEGNMASLDDAPVNTSLIIAATSSTTTTNFPLDFIDYPDGTDGVLFTFETLLPTNNTLIEVQLLIRTHDGKMWRRKKIGSWTTWTDGSLSAANTFAAYANAGGNLSSLNDAEINKIYLVYRTSGTNTTNFPEDYGEGNGLLYTQKSVYKKSYYLNVQMLVKLDTGEIWGRQYVSATSTWSTWKKAKGNLTASDWFGVYTDSATNLASLDDAEVSKTYLIRRNGSTTTTNFPVDFGNGDGILSTYQGQYTSSYWLKFQTLTKLPAGKIWYRQYVSATSAWSGWYSSEGGVITIGQGKMFETLREGFDFAFTQYNAKVVVYPGDYDLVEEFADVLPTISDHAGCPVGRGMHAVFMAGSHITAMVEKGNYTDAQFNAIKLYFHPFAFIPDSANVNDDFIVEGIDISSKNTRYCFHDDFGPSQEPCIHKFIDCKMYRENSNITASDNFVQCIGGGLGVHTTVVIEGGCYQSNPVVGSPKIMNGDLDYQQVPISYHNGNIDDAQSSITLRDVFFADKGYFQTQDYGPSTLKTKCYISGCRFGLPPRVGLRTETTNFELAASWNNDVAQDGVWQIDPEDSTKVIFVASNQ